jgi:hypothetical protein
MNKLTEKDEEEIVRLAQKCIQDFDLANVSFAGEDISKLLAVFQQSGNKPHESAELACTIAEYSEDIEDKRKYIDYSVDTCYRRLDEFFVLHGVDEFTFIENNTWKQFELTQCDFNELVLWEVDILPRLIELAQDQNRTNHVLRLAGLLLSIENVLGNSKIERESTRH